MTLPSPSFRVFMQMEDGPFLSVQEGTLPSPDDRVVVLDDLSWEWSVVEGRLPGEFEPFTLSFGLGAFSMADLEFLHVGTKLAAFIQLDGGAAPGWSLYSEFRVSDVDLEALPTRRRKVLARVTAVDDSADLRSTFPDPSAGLFPTPPITPWKRAICEIAYHSGIRLYAPTDVVWSLDWSAPTLPAWPEVSADEVLARLMNTVTATSSHFGKDRHLTVMPLYTDPPAGYEDLATQSTMYNGAWESYSWDPVTAPPQAFILVPLDRSVHAIPHLPFQPSGNSISLAADPDAVQQGLTVIDGCLIEAPATGRRSRGNAFTVALLEGSTLERNDSATLEWSEGTTQVSGPGVRALGSISRTIPVFTLVRSAELADTSMNERTLIAARARRIANKFLSSATELGAATQFDAFQVRISAMDDPAYAHRLIRGLTPTTPGPFTPEVSSTSTAVLIHGADGDLVEQETIKGFATAGSLVIAAGKVTYSVTIAPGDLELLELGNSHRLSDSLGVYTLNTIDPLLTFADLTLTRRA